MKMNKRLLSLILVVVMVLGMIPLNAVATDENPIEITHIEGCSAECAVEGCTCTCHQVVIVTEDPSAPCSQCDGIYAEDGETVIHNPTCPTKCECTPVDGVHVSPCVFAPAVIDDGGEEETPLCDKCTAVKNEDGTITHETTCEKVQYVAPLCDKCEATKAEDGETIVHEEGCLSKCKCEAVIEGVHSNMECPYYVEPADPVCTGDPATCQIENCECKQPTMAPAPEEESLYEKLLAAETLDVMYDIFMEAQVFDTDSVNALTEEEIWNLLARVDELDPEQENENYLLLAEELMGLPAMTCPECGEVGGHTAECTRNGGYFATKLATSITAPMTLNNGDYELSENTYLKNEGTRLIIPQNALVTLDLKGYVLQGTGSGFVIEVQSGAIFTLKDSSPTLGHKGNITSEGLWKWEDGNYNSQSKGGFIYNKGTGKGISVSGTFNMEGGTIAGCKGDFGSAITGTSSSVMNITGGRILGNVSTREDPNSGVIHGEAPNKNSGSVLQISNATITNNTGAANGGAIYAYNTTLTDCTFTNNKAKNGGAVFAYGGGTLTMTGCIFTGNEATDGKGGAVAGADGTNITMTDCTISSNKAVTYGGGVYRGKNSTLSVSGCTIENNMVTSCGGGIFAYSGGSVTVSDSTLNDNYTADNGGGIYAESSTTISNTDITNNRAMKTETGPSEVNKGRGAGFYITGSGVEATFEDVTVSGNVCFYYGGGGQISGGAKLTIDDGTVFENNKALLHGAGALHVTGDATFVMEGGIMRNNFAQTVGGAIHSSYTCVLELNGGQIINNTANGRGGGININTGGSITLGSGLTISGNTVNNEATGSAGQVDENGYLVEGSIQKNGAHNNNGYGGGLCIDSAICTVNGATISGNHAAVGGGAIALVMLNGTTASGLEDIRVCEFSMYSGTISSNTSAQNGAGVYMMSNGLEQTLRDCYPETSEDEKVMTYGKAAAILGDNLTAKPSAVVSGGTIQNNTATLNGGGLYLDKDTTFEINGSGAITGNKAVDGAGVYIAKGTAEINGGTIQSNAASGDGGGLYVLGNVTMTDGVVRNNTAVGDGGALYITSDTTNDVIGNFTMTSGKLLNNKAGNGENLSNGGGAYVFGGNITIGVPACEGDTTEGTRPNHTVEPTNKIHPLIQGNTATDSGGGLALIGSGNITMYCGNITNNDATNRGRGLNVYMEEGKFDYYNGDVGALESPELVIVGGTLVNNKLLENGNITLKYYHCNDKEEFPGEHTGDLEDKTATATKLSKFNLPDGEKYWEAPEDYRFFGWTFYGPNDENAPDHVRNKDHYKPMGEPIVAQDVYDGIATDNTIEMYALWAPETSSITYVGNVINDTFTEAALSATNQTTYSFSISDYDIVLNSPVKSGYTFLGWYYYQDEGQNANWGIEPDYKEGTTEKVYANLNYGSDTTMGFLDVETSGENKGKCILPVEATNFGNITLIAKFKPAFTTLIIDKHYPEDADYSMDVNQSFAFKVEGYANDTATYPSKLSMTVVVQEDGEAIIEHLPVGTYTVTEITEWSWRYMPETASFTVEAIDAEVDYEVDFTNTRSKVKWLDGDSICVNWFNGSKFVAK